MIMSHMKSLELLEKDEELTETERAELLLHITECRDCQKNLKIVGRVLKLIKLGVDMLKIEILIPDERGMSMQVNPKIYDKLAKNILDNLT